MPAQTNLSDVSPSAATTHEGPAGNTAIPQDDALRLCSAIWVKNRHKWYTAAGMMCRGCMTFSKGDPAKRCFASSPDNRGCYQVNAQYDQQTTSAG